MGKKMSKKEFDQIIKDLIGNDTLFGYKKDSNDKKPYSMYYSEDVFNKFVSGMSEEHRKCFSSGAGKELEPKTVMIKGIQHVYPPKMASVASSSRFCYLALRNGIDITLDKEHINGNPIFEKACKIDFSLVDESTDKYCTAPHLDAYIPESHCYFEIKCHEIFDSHKVVLKQKYWKFIYGKKKLFDLKLPPKPITDSKTFEIPIEEFGITNKVTTRFDIKQLICHLLGIATDPKRKNESNKKLVYLFFRPDPDKLKMNSTIIENELEKVFDELKTEIELIFGSKPIKTFCDKEHIKLMAIAEKSSVMEPLTNKNLEVLYTSKK